MKNRAKSTEQKAHAAITAESTAGASKGVHILHEFQSDLREFRPGAPFAHFRKKMTVFNIYFQWKKKYAN